MCASALPCSGSRTTWTPDAVGKHSGHNCRRETTRLLLCSKTIAQATHLSCEAARPAPDSQLPSDSARQPAYNPQDAEIDSIAGIAAWLGTLPEGTVGGSAPMKRLAEAVSTLQTLPSRDRRCQLQKLFRSWDVEQFAQSSGKRKLHDVEQSFEAKVIQEAKRLKVLQRSSNTFSLSLIHI